MSFSIDNYKWNTTKISGMHEIYKKRIYKLKWNEIWYIQSGEEIRSFLYSIGGEMLSLLDVLVDGPFKEEEKDITLAFRGSRNQRVIDMQRSLKEKEVILHLE